MIIWKLLEEGLEENVNLFNIINIILRFLVFVARVDEGMTRD